MAHCSGCHVACGSGRAASGSACAAACTQQHQRTPVAPRPLQTGSNRQPPLRRVLPLPLPFLSAQVVVGSQRHDFTWLQRVLKQRCVRLTSNELAYELQSKVACICVDAGDQLTAVHLRSHGLVGWCPRSWVVCYPPIAALARHHLFITPCPCSAPLCCMRCST